MDKTKQRLTEMLVLQDQLNRKINQYWHKAEYPWYRAAMVEACELHDHIGWKWWSHQEPNISQAKLELVDIWHFGLSALLCDHNGSFTTASSVLHNALTMPCIKQTFDLHIGNTIDTFIAETSNQRVFPVVTFFQLCNMLDLSFNELYSLYIGKNVLNCFRQDHGYNNGTYRKRWEDGREDNDHLYDIVELILEDPNAENSEAEIYDHLSARYS